MCFTPGEGVAGSLMLQTDLHEAWNVVIIAQSTSAQRHGTSRLNSKSKMQQSGAMKYGGARCGLSIVCLLVTSVLQ